MNRLLGSVWWLLAVCLIAAGCGGRAAGTQSGPIQIEVDRVAEQADLVVVRARVTFPGERKVRLWQEGDSESSRVAADKETGLAACDVMFVADLINAGETRRLKWHHWIQSAGGMAGGPGIYAVEDDAKLADMLQIQLESGDYPFGQEIEVATFRDQTLRLKVE